MAGTGTRRISAKGDGRQISVHGARALSPRGALPEGADSIQPCARRSSSAPSGAWGSWGPGVVWARLWEVVGTRHGVGGSWGSWELSAVWAAWGPPSESGARAGCRVQDQEQGGSWEQGLVAASRGRTCGDSIVVGPGSVTDPAAAA